MPLMVTGTDDRRPLGLTSDSHLEYFTRGGRAVTEESFLVCMTKLCTAFASLVVLARRPEDPGANGAYAAPEDVEFVAMPDYPSLSRPLGAQRAACDTLARLAPDARLRERTLDSQAGRVARFIAKAARG